MARATSDKTFDTIEDSIEAKKNDIKHSYSLHGSKAAFRRAITELLFFASVGGESLDECVGTKQALQP